MPNAPRALRSAVLSGSHFIKVLQEPRPKSRSEIKYLFVNSIALQKVKSRPLPPGCPICHFGDCRVYIRIYPPLKYVKGKGTSRRFKKTKPNKAKLRRSGRGSLPGEVSWCVVDSIPRSCTRRRSIASLLHRQELGKSSTTLSSTRLKSAEHCELVVIRRF